jgi:FtsP/CotA-like multicopper oxidase with cupredoxin domain
MKKGVSPVLVFGAVGLGVWLAVTTPWRNERVATRVGPTSALVEEAEKARRSEGAAVRDITLTAAPATVRLGDRLVETRALNGTVPGPEIRLRAGEVLRARVENELPASLTIHWHGLALRNDMDGVQ